MDVLLYSESRHWIGILAIMSDEKANIKKAEPEALLFRSLAGWAAAALVGIAAVLAARHLGLSDRSAAQMSIGLFGLAGGLSQAFLIRSAGGNVSPGQGLLLAAAWALSCAAGVTLMFLTFGTPAKMALITFCSFALSGALGGLATVLLMRSAFREAAGGDLIPSVVQWSFGFGLAALAVELIGQGLQWFLPLWLAWSAAAAAMAMIIGAAGACAIAGFLKAGVEKDQLAKQQGRDDETFTNGRNAFYLWILILLVLPFYLNDFADIYVKDWRQWLWIDYLAVKLFPVLVIVWLLLSGKMRAPAFGLTPQPALSFLAVFLIGTLAGLFLDQNGYALLNGFPGYQPLGAMPEIKSPLWKGVDLTAGLLLVGIMEEVIFRGYLHTVLSRYTRNSLVIIAVSAVAFGCIHWSGGFHRILVTGVIGAVFMVLYLRTRSLPAIILAHFAINFIDFSEIINKAIFRF
jgi:hypothetical protein